MKWSVIDKMRMKNTHAYIYIYIHTHHCTTQACIHSTKGNNPTIELVLVYEWILMERKADDRCKRISF